MGLGLDWGGAIQAGMGAWRQAYQDKLEVERHQKEMEQRQYQLELQAQAQENQAKYQEEVLGAQYGQKYPGMGDTRYRVLTPNLMESADRRLPPPPPPGSPGAPGANRGHTAWSEREQRFVPVPSADQLGGRSPQGGPTTLMTNPPKPGPPGPGGPDEIDLAQYGAFQQDGQTLAPHYVIEQMAEKDKQIDALEVALRKLQADKDKDGGSKGGYVGVLPDRDKPRGSRAPAPKDSPDVQAAEGKLKAARATLEKMTTGKDGIAMKYVNLPGVQKAEMDVKRAESQVDSLLKREGKPPRHNLQDSGSSGGGGASLKKAKVKAGKTLKLDGKSYPGGSPVSLPADKYQKALDAGFIEEAK